MWMRGLWVGGAGEDPKETEGESRTSVILGWNFWDVPRGRWQPSSYSFALKKSQRPGRPNWAAHLWSLPSGLTQWLVAAAAAVKASTSSERPLHSSEPSEKLMSLVQQMKQSIIRDRKFKDCRLGAETVKSVSSIFLVIQSSGSAGVIYISLPLGRTGCSQSDSGRPPRRDHRKLCGGFVWKDVFLDLPSTFGGRPTLWVVLRGSPVLIRFTCSSRGWLKIELIHSVININATISSKRVSSH